VEFRTRPGDRMRELHSEREGGAPQLGCSHNSRALAPPQKPREPTARPKTMLALPSVSVPYDSTKAE
jgi:hypothetical protein